MVTKKDLRTYEFKSIDQYFDYIVESVINGQKKQAIDLINELSNKQKKEALNYFNGFQGLFYIETRNILINQLFN